MPKTNLKTTNPESAVNEKATLDPRWIVKIEGRHFVTYPGLLDLGHQKGLESIEVEPLQLPNDQNGHFAGGPGTRATQAIPLCLGGTGKAVS